MFSAIWNTIFYEPVLNVLLIFYSLLGNNLGWAIIIFTIVLKVILYPVTRTQLDSSSKIKKIQPELEKIKSKYSDNPQKFQEEQMKLYKKVGYNPLGCFLSIVIPFPILFAIYQAIRLFSNGASEISGVYNFVSNWLNIGNDFVVNTDFYFLDLSKAYIPQAKDLGYLALSLLPYLLLAILTGVSQYFSVKYGSGENSYQKNQNDAKDKKSKKKSESKDVEDSQQMVKDMSKSMTLTFPLVTAFVALSMPAGLSLYWVLQSLLTIGSRFVYNRHVEKNV